MSLLPLTNEEKGHLQRLNKNQPVIFALKKLFLNEIVGAKQGDVQLLAAERIAMKYIEAVFHELSTIQPDNTKDYRPENSV